MTIPRDSRRLRFVRSFALRAAAIVLASSSLFVVHAQDAGAPAENPTSKWLAAQHPQWQAAFDRDVKEPFDKGLADLNKQYLAAFEKLFKQATQEGKLDDALIYRAERDRIAGAGAKPLGDDPTPAPAVENMRAFYRKSLAAIEAERMDRAKKLLARYDAVLAQNQLALTKAERLDEALLVKRSARKSPQPGTRQQRACRQRPQPQPQLAPWPQHHQPRPPAMRLRRPR